MNIEEIYNKNKKNLLFSNNELVNKYRDQLIYNFANDKFDKKNNESIKNINLKDFFHFKYKYLEPKNLKKIIIKKDNTYNITSFNGMCENYTDDKIEIKKFECEEFYSSFDNNLFDKNDHFVNLNSLFLNSGYKIKVKKNNNLKIKISNIVSEANLTVFQKNFILCEEGASVNLIEEYENKNDSISNIINIIELEKNAYLNHLIIQDIGNNHNLIITSNTICKKESKYQQRVFNFSDSYVRNFHFSNLNEINSEVDLQGIFFLKDDNKANNKTFVMHSAENCKSNQIYKGILNDKSKATYYSNTYVNEVAQKTEGYQLSKGILLSDKSEYFSKPELKIYADDVKCSHGSTIGPIDENAIFYLRSRGMSKNAATKILVSSFINQELNSINDNHLSEVIEIKLNRYLSQLK